MVIPQIVFVDVAAPIFPFRLNCMYIHMSQAVLNIGEVTFYNINVISGSAETQISS